MTKARLRFPPSPTGPLHIGNVRTGLFNYLLAKKLGGAYVLRIEDTDQERSKKKYESEIFESLKWLGLTPDEGPQEGGPFGPYRQTERHAFYDAALKLLLAEGKVFYCSHALAAENEKPAVHWCEFRDGGAGQGIIRFKTPKEEVITFADIIRGPISVETNLIGDFSIARNLESPLYNFANVIDDHEMQITHVLRGEDHIPNTPKQILLQRALGYESPQYGHLPLILGKDRSKLSKRHGAVALAEYQRQGYLPEAIINYLALLGWNPGTEQEIFTRNELIDCFSIEKVHRAGAVFDTEKLDWMNGEYIRRTPLADLTEKLIPFLSSAGIQTETIARDTLEQIILLEQPRLKKLAEIGERVDFYFREPKITVDLLQWKLMSAQEISAALDESIELLTKFKVENPTKDCLEAVFLPAATARGDRGSLLWPLRAALTGKKASPGPFDIIPILGKAASVKRLESAKAILRG